MIPYFSLAAGFLTGKYRSEADFAKSARGPGLKKYLNARGTAVLGGLDAVAARQGATLAQVALAWLMAQPGVTAPIASATSVAQLEELMGAARLKLDAESLRTLDATRG
jgi:aryl-alcohol dehydrogenase-like predicted oxidoreductase